MTGAKRVTSAANPILRQAAALRDRRARRESGRFLVEGEKLLIEAISGGISLETVFYEDTKEERFGPLLARLAAEGTELICLPEQLLRKLCEAGTPQGLAGVARMPEPAKLPDTLPEGAALVAMEDIQDPGNLGTVLRTAHALGFYGAVLAGNCADLYSVKVLRGSMGAAFRLPVFLAEDGPGAAEMLQRAGAAVYAAALSPDSLPVTACDFSGRVAVMIGNEGAGLTPAAVGACDGQVVIPMKNGAQSLNAAAAAAILLWEISRSRNEG